MCSDHRWYPPKATNMFSFLLQAVLCLLPSGKQMLGVLTKIRHSESTSCVFEVTGVGLVHLCLTDRQAKCLTNLKLKILVLKSLNLHICCPSAQICLTVYFGLFQFLKAEPVLPMKWFNPSYSELRIGPGHPQREVEGDTHGRGLYKNQQ